MLSGNVADLSYPKSKIRRGRVQGNYGDISPTLTCGCNAVHKIDLIKENRMEKTKIKYAIRKLTPRECYRLQGVTEKQIDKMLAKESNSQNYKAAGNSICVPVLIAIFSQLGIQGHKKWNDMTLDEKKKLIYKEHILEKKNIF